MGIMGVNGQQSCVWRERNLKGKWNLRETEGGRERMSKNYEKSYGNLKR